MSDRLQDYMQYFQVDGDAVYIREDFINRLSELKGHDLSYLMRIVFSTDDNRTTQKIIRAFESGKPARITQSVTIKENIPAELRWAVWERDNFTCQHCGSRRFLTVDHIYPESKGGKLTMDNCQTLCKSCNSKKGAR